MNTSLTKPLLRSVCAVLLLQPLLIATTAADMPTPLIDKVRNATARYLDINVAVAEGFVAATPCVSGPDTGAMGVHFVLVSRISAGVLNAEQPEALIYEPMSNGAMRLVGVEFIVLESVWAAKNPGGGVPASPAYCECFDRDGDHDIDATDFTKFMACATRTDVPWASTPGCP